MSNNTEVSTSGGSFFGLLFIAFLVLKLTEVIDWSWWWITAPLWIPFTVFLVTVSIVLLFVGIRKPTRRS